MLFYYQISVSSFKELNIINVILIIGVNFLKGLAIQIFMRTCFDCPSLVYYPLVQLIPVYTYHNKQYSLPLVVMFWSTHPSPPSLFFYVAQHFSATLTHNHTCGHRFTHKSVVHSLVHSVDSHEHILSGQLQ